MPGFAQAGGGLGPAEGLLDPFPDDLADFVAGVSGGASIDGRAPGLGGHVRGNVDRAQLVDEVLGVIPLVGAERDAPRSVSARLDHVERGDALGVAVGLGEAGVHDQAMPVLHERMAHEAQPGFAAQSLAIEPRVGIGGTLMGLVGAVLAVEVALAVAPGGSPEPSFGRKLFIEAQASISVPSTLPCSVDSRRFTRGWASTAARNLCATSPASSRSRFLPKVV